MNPMWYYSKVMVAHMWIKHGGVGRALWARSDKSTSVAIPFRENTDGRSAGPGALERFGARKVRAASNQTPSSIINPGSAETCAKMGDVEQHMPIVAASRIAMTRRPPFNGVIWFPTE